MAVERLDNICTVRMSKQKPKEGGPPGATEPVLFAQCNIDLSTASGNQQQQPQPQQRPLEYFAEGVVDSSRYFVLRIENPETNQSIHIGVGFRERDDASNFRMALQDYERSIKRQQKAEAMHLAYEGTTATAEGDTEEATTAQKPEVLPEVSKLTLKEGEKIHIKLRGHDSTPGKKKERKGSKTGVPLLLKKPPPPADIVPPPPSPVIETVLSLDDMEKVQVDRERNFELDSECAVGSQIEDDIPDDEDEDDDEDEWDDFKSPTDEPAT
eukprot:CAMPEP_0202451762 /NCGR_PEP_ID=MMETSP1360-20130828/10127_1 /ASSEMBLY_ACC=CAM_ASM_000848 /TAXON_ID=515479 /ORGANISM="Licmophora paradoxa, Strain CCMP2313" /LENGTH=268 /DNA_ID=CAMNT_0049070415 /DNA_START=94 /DNA_END=900 /DNA_ORIENTATION=-